MCFFETIRLFAAAGFLDAARLFLPALSRSSSTGVAQSTDLASLFSFLAIRTESARGSPTSRTSLSTTLLSVPTALHLSSQALGQPLGKQKGLPNDLYTRAGPSERAARPTGGSACLSSLYIWSICVGPCRSRNEPGGQLAAAFSRFPAFGGY